MRRLLKGCLWLGCLAIPVVVGAVMAFVWLPFPSHHVLALLEQRFPAQVLRDDVPVAGIIGLGGEFKRFEAAMRLAAHRPGAQLLLSAGGEEVRTLALARQMTLAPGQLVIDSASTTTFENARMAAELLQPRPDQVWILVTSAFHMPRAVGTFRRAGFRVIAWPVYHAIDDSSRPVGFFVLKELVGLIVYRLLNRSQSLYPSPLAGGAP